MQLSATNRAHVGVIRDLLDACGGRAAKVWLLGGWGIDALLGRITREHHDVDLITRRTLREALRQVVGKFADEITEDSPVMLQFWRDGVRVDTRFFYQLLDGTLVSDLDMSDPCVYLWPPGSFPEEPNGTLLGVSCWALSWEAQFVAKEGYSWFKKGEPLRARDKADLAVIRQHLDAASLKGLERYFPGVPRPPGEQ